MSDMRILIVFVGIYSALCFAKQNFQVMIDRVEITDANSDMVNATVKVIKYNRTFKALSANFTLLKDLGYDVIIDVKVFTLFSNEYRPSPVSFRRKLCDFYKMEYLWAKKQIEKYSNFPSKCPIRAGDYNLIDFALDGADVPANANFPWTSIMIHFRAFYKDAVYFGIKVYVTLDHDIELKRLG